MALSFCVLNLPAIGGVAYYLWPAAGLVIAAVLVYGEKILYGVFIGAFLVNTRFSNFMVTAPLFDIILNSVVVSAGAILNPYIVSVIFKIFGLRVRKLQDYKEIFGVLIIGGILGSIITSTVGSLSLFYSKAIGFEIFIENWLAWWVGDTLGVFLFFPIFFQIFKYDLFKKRRIFLTSLPVLIGVILSCFYHFRLSSAKIKLNQSILEDKSVRIYNRIVSDIENKKIVIESFKAFFESSDDITRDDFFLYSNIFINKLPELNGVMWAPRYEAKKLKEFNLIFSKIYSKTITDLEKILINKTENETLYPVLYAEPFYRMVNYVGHDYSNKFTTDNLDLGFTSRNELLINFETVEEENQRERLILKILAPVFHNKNRLLQGYVISEINFSKSIENILEKLKFRNTHLQILESKVDFKNTRKVIFSNFQKNDYNHDFYKSKNSFHFGDTILDFEVYETDFDKQQLNSFSENIFIVVSLLFTSVLGVILLLVIGQKETIAEIVDLKTIDLKKSKLDIEKSADQLKELSSFKGQFLQVISADIKKILLTIDSSIREVEIRKNENEIRANIIKIKNDHRILNHIIDDVIYYADVDSPKFLLKFSNFNFIEMLHKLSEKYFLIAEQKGLKFNLSVSGDCPEYIYSDKERLMVVIENLIENAISYTQVGKVEVVVSAQSMQNHMSFINILIKDSGVGISEENLKNIFTLSSTINLKVNKEIQSSGLGLVTSSKILKHLGSDLNVTSIVNKGSEFSFSFASKIVSSLSSKDFADNDYSLYADLNVLFCEDNQINQKVISAIAKKLLLRFDIASNGADAIELARVNKYDVIFMDINMPTLNGLDTTNEIKNNTLNAKTPIIALTLNLFAETRQLALDIGMSDYVEKPIRSIEVIRVLKNVVDKKYIT